MTLQPPILAASRPSQVLQEQKYPDESRVFTFDFSNFPEMQVSGAALATPTVVPSPLDNVIVVSNVAVNGFAVTAQIAAGTAGTIYLLRCDVHTNASPVATLTLYMKLFVIDPATL